MIIRQKVSSKRSYISGTGICTDPCGSCRAVHKFDGVNMKDMSNTLKKSFVFKRFYLELVEKYGTARAKDIWNYAENEFLGLRIAEPSADKALELGTPEAVQMIFTCQCDVIGVV